MSFSSSSKARLLVSVVVLTGLVWFVLQEQSVQSLLFLSPVIPPGGGPRCEDPQIACPEGGTKGFGPVTIHFPNGFYMEKVRVYCDIREASSVPACPSGFNPVGQPVSCYFGKMNEKPVIAFQQPIHVTMAIPASQASHVVLYMYQHPAWTRLSPEVPVGEGVVTVSLESLSPVGSEKLNYFWLFESQPGIQTPTTGPIRTQIATKEPLPTESLTPTLTSTPTESPTPAPTGTPTPTNTSTPTESLPSPSPTKELAGPSDGTLTSVLVVGGLMFAAGVAVGVFLALRKKTQVSRSE